MEKYLEEKIDAKRVALPSNYNDYITAASKMFETDLKNYKAGPRAKAFTSEQSWLLQNLKRMLNDNALKEHGNEIGRLYGLFKPKIDDQWLIRDLRQLKRDHTKGDISDLGLIEEITDLTTSTAKYLLKRNKQKIETEPDFSQILYSKYLET